MGRRPSNKPTSFDIAYLAGVSQPTVSRALRGSKSVSAATRQKIEAIAQQLNYTVDRNTSSSNAPRTNTIALLLFEGWASNEWKINAFFMAMLESITRQCADRMLDLLISFQKLDGDWHTRFENSQRADGLILLGNSDDALHNDRLGQLRHSGTPFVHWGAREQGASVSTTDTDDFAAGRLVGESLVEAVIGRIEGQLHIASPSLVLRGSG